MDTLLKCDGKTTLTECIRDSGCVVLQSIHTFYTDEDCSKRYVESQCPTGDMTLFVNKECFRHIHAAITVNGKLIKVAFPAWYAVYKLVQAFEAEKNGRCSGQFA